MLIQVPLLQSTTSQGATSGDGVTMTMEVVKGTIIVASKSVAVVIMKKSVSEMLTSGEVGIDVVKGARITDEEVRGTSEVTS
jgi:hypothetical protein